jgi:hypothetical protein
MTMSQSSATDPAVGDTGSTDALGPAYADALSRKDFEKIAGLLHPEVDFRALTPRREWQADRAEAVIDEVLRTWFEDSDQIEQLVSVEADSFADRHRVAYRFNGRNPDGRFVVEQQVYYAERDGRIGWMRVLCSGFRPR